MSAEQVPQERRPQLTSAEKVEMIVNEMLLLRLFPNHEQIDEFRRNVEYARRRMPSLYAQAELLVKDQMAAEDRLLAHPEECLRCGGTRTFSWEGRMRFCGCAAGDRACKTEVLREVAPRLAVTPKPMSARQQLEQLRSLFDSEE